MCWLVEQTRVRMLPFVIKALDFNLMELENICDHSCWHSTSLKSKEHKGSNIYIRVNPRCIHDPSQLPHLANTSYLVLCKERATNKHTHHCQFWLNWSNSENGLFVCLFVLNSTTGIPSYLSKKGFFCFSNHAHFPVFVAAVYDHVIVLITVLDFPFVPSSSSMAQDVTDFAGIGHGWSRSDLGNGSQSQQNKNRKDLDLSILSPP